MWTVPRFLRVVGPWLFIVLWFACAVAGQTETATVSGLVTDRSAAAVSGAEVRLQSVERGTVTSTTTNNAGIYVFPSVQPGQYQISIQKQGFKQVDLLGLIVNVQDHIEQNFRLEVGSVTESVTVEAGASIINTTDASVSTVVDQTYVKNMPLNGRSFQDLILLTPGVVTSSPQTVGSVNAHGEFSVNGQRTESNYYSVDGVSTNVGVFSAPRAATSGSLPASTVLGTTQGLVSVDALEEFRVQSSTSSAEYGRNPGGQFSFATRSGSNQWHGNVFDYLRNDFFDANDWFNNFFSRPRAALRQNDFGGTLGGPLGIPHVYSGKDKTFFFFSYEGLRLIQPQAATPIFVPDLCMRGTGPCPTSGPGAGRTPAATALQPVMNAFPLPSPNGLEDAANGLGQFIGSWSNPSSIDSTSIRLDHVVNEKWRLFFRFSNSDSTTTPRNPSGDPAVHVPQSYKTRTYTGGATSTFSSRVSNEFRVNYSSNEFRSSNSAPDNFGGAQPVNLLQLQGVDARTFPLSQVLIDLILGANTAFVFQSQALGEQRQWNVVDAVSISLGRHQVKVGVNFRRLAPILSPTGPTEAYLYFSESAVEGNRVDSGFAQSTTAEYPVYANFSAFAQDEWRVTPRLTVSTGLRWEVNPAPGGKTSNRPYTVQGSSLANLALAPQGTPLWNTAWYNFAPRLGVAYIVRNTPGFETVVRGGGGVYFDTGQQIGSLGFQGPGFTVTNSFGSAASFPVPVAQINPPIINPPTPPWSAVVAFPQHFQLPYTLQWNASIEQALGKAQVITVSYVAANGRRLVQANQVNISKINPNFSGPVTFVGNGLTSDYNALQVQFQRRLNRGLTALGSYTWSHSIDFGSNDAALPFIRGNSDFDVRHNFSGAFSYELPNVFKGRVASLVLHHWGLDDRFTARTGFPVTLRNGTRNLVDPVTGQVFQGGLDIKPGVPVYLFGGQFPGGQEINPAAFTKPASGLVGDAPRNFARGLGAWQMDLALRREFPIHERLKLQFRAEAFNVFNHPNFGTTNGVFGQATFGQATATLAQSLGILSPLYQAGGPRSLQFALKLAF